MVRASIDNNHHKALLAENSLTGEALPLTGSELPNASPLHIAIVDASGNQVINLPIVLQAYDNDGHLQNITAVESADAPGSFGLLVLNYDGSSVSTGGGSSAININVDDATHGHTAEEPEVNVGKQIVAQDADHAHEATEPTITQTHVISVADATHDHSATEPTITQVHEIVVQDASHGHTAEEATVELAGDKLLLEDGDILLLEDGDQLLLE